MPDPLSSRKRFSEVLGKGEQALDLAEAALLIAQEEYPGLDPRPYLERLEILARRVKSLRPRGAGPREDAAALNAVLFDEEGFSGNEEHYYDPRNSFLNEVMDRKTGIPITLSLIYMEVARRAGVPVAGVGLPGHFIVRHMGEAEPPLFIDPFHKGAFLTPEACGERVQRIYGGKAAFRRDYLEPVPGFAVLSRMLYNLKNIYVESKSYAKALIAIDRLALLNPGAWDEVRDRGVVLYRLKQYKPALRDLELYLGKVALAPDRAQILRLAGAISRKIKQTERP
jgi:regulator of sirC expression with transglutaminase-like and TPR domain